MTDKRCWLSAAESIRVVPLRSKTPKTMMLAKCSDRRDTESTTTDVMLAKCSDRQDTRVHDDKIVLMSNRVVHTGYHDDKRKTRSNRVVHRDPDNDDRDETLLQAECCDRRETNSTTTEITNLDVSAKRWLVTDTVTETARAFAGLKRYVDSRLAARTQYRNFRAAVLVSGSTEVPSRMRDREPLLDVVESCRPRRSTTQ
jgi:hypothetical protein